MRRDGGPGQMVRLLPAAVDVLSASFDNGSSSRDINHMASGQRHLSYMLSRDGKLLLYVSYHPLLADMAAWCTLQSCSLP